MIGLSGIKRWAITAVFALIAVAGVSFIPADSAQAANGEFRGGRYTFEFKGEDIPIEGGEDGNTTVLLSPAVDGADITIADGNIVGRNIPEGTYTVTIKFQINEDMCERAWYTRIAAAANPAITAFCAFTGTGDTYYGATKVIPNVVIRGGQTTTLEPPSGNLGTAIQTDANGNPVIDCSGKGIIMSFVICPIIENTLGVIDWIVENFIQPYLIINPLTTTVDGQPSELYQIWSNIRNVANILFIGVFFAVIFSQATSIGISNYGIKRILPRLILVGIATNISFFICAFLVDVFNVLGIGIASLMVAGVVGGSLVFDPGNADFIIGLGIGAMFTGMAPLLVAAAAAIIFGVFIFLFIAVIVLGIAAVVILIRQVVIIFLVLASPIAFVAALLPNTQNYFKQWFSMFMRLLIMYPLIMGLFAAGKIASVVIQRVGGQ